jgi:3'-5' exoribonuclease
VDISGEISTYKDIPQIQIKLIALAKKTNLSEFVPSLEKKRIDELTLSLDKIVIKNDVCRKIWEEILNPPFRDKFKSCPGGIGDVHHAYIGGLLDHSACMVQISQGLIDSQFKDLDKDILITGCLIHDIGKIESYQWDGIPEMTDAGRLFHHTYIGYGMFLQMADKLDILRSDQTFMKLAHIIVSHHEDEGIRKTMLPEATAVAMIDNLNASTNFALSFVGKEENKETDSNWTRFCQLTGRQYYIPKKAENLDITSILNDLK